MNYLDYFVEEQDDFNGVRISLCKSEEIEIGVFYI
jgi:hypothetical protein